MVWYLLSGGKPWAPKRPDAKASHESFAKKAAKTVVVGGIGACVAAVGLVKMTNWVLHRRAAYKVHLKTSRRRARARKALKPILMDYVNEKEDARFSMQERQIFVELLLREWVDTGRASKFKDLIALVKSGEYDRRAFYFEIVMTMRWNERDQIQWANGIPVRKLFDAGEVRPDDIKAENARTGKNMRIPSWKELDPEFYFRESSPGQIFPFDAERLYKLSQENEKVLKRRRKARAAHLKAEAAALAAQLDEAENS